MWFAALILSLLGDAFHALWPAPPPPAVACMSDERQWGTTCCRVMHHGSRRTSLSCRGPQLGKACHKSTDCDIACGCDRSLVHHDGMTGVTGTCTGYQPSGEWLCRLDAQGHVSSLIID